ncbi:MAG: hypothetical protein JWN06_2650 [Propionibacteriaceae bacterium]|nr:hypothetical protein [Propionibacteriaceae bacterium]
MPAAGRGRELSNDPMAAIAVAVVAVTIVWAERRLIAAAMGRWLQQPHHVDARAGRLHDPVLGRPRSAPVAGRRRRRRPDRSGGCLVAATLARPGPYRAGTQQQPAAASRRRARLGPIANTLLPAWEDSAIITG